MKKDLGCWTNNFNLCCLASEAGDGCNKSWTKTWKNIVSIFCFFFGDSKVGVVMMKYWDWMMIIDKKWERTLGDVRVVTWVTETGHIWHPSGCKMVVQLHFDRQLAITVPSQQWWLFWKILTIPSLISKSDHVFIYEELLVLSITHSLSVICSVNSG